MNPHHSAPFRQNGATATTATTTTSSTAIALGGVARERVAVAHNISTTHAAVRFGDSAVSAATAADIIIPPNSKRLVHLLDADTHFRAIALSGTGIVYVEVGDGTIT